MLDSLTEVLQGIKKIAGVESVLLVHRDGLPVANSGIWVNKDEVLVVASSTCAISGVANLIHGSYKYLLLESDTSKVVLASLPDVPNYFLTIITAPGVDSDALFIEVKDSLLLLTSLLSEHVEDIAVAESRDFAYGFARSMISLDRSQSLTLRDLLREVHDCIPYCYTVFLALGGGIRVSMEGFTNDRLVAMSFALYDASERFVRKLRNMSLRTVLCETEDLYQFICPVPYGAFSMFVEKHGEELDLMRTHLKHYTEEIGRILQTTSFVVSDSLKDAVRELDPDHFLV